MSRATSHPASITGYAVVRLKNGNSYVGLATYDGRAITINGSLRVIVNGVVEHRPRPRRTVPLHLVREIVWDQ
jgi:hypothetical protein